VSIIYFLNILSKSFKNPQSLQYFDFQAMLFINFTGEGAESLKSKYREVATSNKGQGLSFLLGDAENSQGAFQVSLILLSSIVYLQGSIGFKLLNTFLSFLNH